MRMFRFSAGTFMASLPENNPLDTKAKPMLVTLIGDSIRKGYEASVSAELSDRAETWGPEQNGGDSENVLNHLDEWVLERNPDIVHMNCGLHDLRTSDGDYQVPLDNYVHNLHEIIDRLRGEFAGKLIWATTTPVIDERHQSVKPFERHEEDVHRYNEGALAVMRSHGVPINDLHEVVVNAGPPQLLKQDGVHFTEEGYKLLGEHVASSILTMVD